MIKSISVSSLNKLNAINIVDIRSVEKYNSSHINGALNIPINELIRYPGKYFNKKDIYYIYCQRGIQSIKLCSILQDLGYNVVNVNGGYEAWILHEV